MEQQNSRRPSTIPRAPNTDTLGEISLEFENGFLLSLQQPHVEAQSQNQQLMAHDSGNGHHDIHWYRLTGKAPLFWLSLIWLQRRNNLESLTQEPPSDNENPSAMCHSRFYSRSKLHSCSLFTHLYKSGGLRMSSTLVGASGRVYVPDKVLKSHPKRPGLNICLAQYVSASWTILLVQTSR